MLSIEEIKNHIVDVKDFPKPGIVFKDITPLFEDPRVFKSLIDLFSAQVPETTTQLVAIESRGFILGSALAYAKGLPFCLVRKPNKLPREVVTQTYDLEYGCDELQVHTSSLKPSDHVLIIDDVLATGGTARAVESLCEQLKVASVSSLFLMELSFLNGKDKLKHSHKSLICL